MPKGRYAKHLSVGVDAEMLDALDRFADHRELTRSGAVRWIVSHYLHKRAYLRRATGDLDRKDPAPDHGVSPSADTIESRGENHE